MVQQIQHLRDENTVNGTVQEAAAIVPAAAEEAESLARTELERLLDLLTSLEPADWERETYCTRWNVRQVVSHLAGATAIHADRAVLLERATAWTQKRADEPGQSMAGYMAELLGMTPERRQSYREAGFNPLDTVTQFEVDEHASSTPLDLIAELRIAGPPAFANRRTMPEPMRSLRLPIGIGVIVPVQAFVDVILPRDMWMHRMEIAIATGRPIVRAAEHEGRLTALVMRDLARQLTPALGETPIIYRLTGPDGGNFRFGPDATPFSTLTMDTVDFHLLASGRMTPAEARANSAVSVEGDDGLAERVLSETVVPY
ncbi:MAG TPA: maleylpyruvate isomerase family mycothiol-dependent enzyme [Chloroflexota bacterium]|nr:maleylpyruvate isomerase family mycothiol-dependent enzyme [Chloroflexota bacterium]